MGLDISAYSQVEHIDDLTKEEWENRYWMNHEKLGYRTVCIDEWVFADDAAFPGAAEGLKPGVYRFDEEHSFRAGSYSGYNRWREQLSMMALNVWPASIWKSPRLYEGRPFYRLINFSDCEGIIGPVEAAKLAQDFATHQAAADAQDDEWFRKQYANWRKAFELAADNGYVDFR